MILTPEADKTGWIVDGQLNQVCSYPEYARIGKFPVFVTGFITDSVAEQRETIRFPRAKFIQAAPQGS